MSEAIIVRGGKSTNLNAINSALDSINSSINDLKEEVSVIVNGIPDDYVTENGFYTFNHSGNYLIELIGGGGSGGRGASFSWEYGMRIGGGGGGGSGFMNRGIIHFNAGDQVYCTIGAGAPNDFGATGGTTSFGIYLSAAGGTGGKEPLSADIYFYSANGGNGYNNGSDGLSVDTAYSSIPQGTFIADGAFLYYSFSTNEMFNNGGNGNRLYYGEGGPGTGMNGYRLINVDKSGNNGIIGIRYVG